MLSILLIAYPSARQQTALWHIALVNFLPTVKVVMYSGSSNAELNNDPCIPRQFHRHNLSEHECMVPLLKRVMEQDGGHQVSLSVHGHCSRRFFWLCTGMSLSPIFTVSAEIDVSFFGWICQGHFCTKNAVDLFKI